MKAFCLAVASVVIALGALPALASAAPVRGQSSPDGPVIWMAKRAIDKSCIMMCDKWGPDGCEKWVMRCKGDPGYPKTIQQLQ